jgi:hypothetical protein
VTELWVRVREAIGAEVGRQIGAGYGDDLDLDGVAHAVTEAFRSFMRDELDRAEAAADKAWREAGYE